MITAQEVAGLNPAAVTIKILKRTSAVLRFFFTKISSSFLDTNFTKQFLLLKILVYLEKKRMKTFFTTAFFVLLLSLVSCTTSNETIDPTLLIPITPSATSGTSTSGSTGTNVALGVFKADFDGQTFTANSTQAIVNNTTIAITGLKADGSFFQITLLGIPTTGTYNNTNSTQLALAYSAGSGQTPYLGASNSSFSAYPNYTDSAELKILSIDTANKIIKGTFKFMGGQINPVTNQLNTKVFTNGEFNLNYAADVPAPVNNNFFAKIDGVDFIPTNISGIKTNGTISVIGRRGSVENIGLSFDDTITAGTTLTFTPLSNTRGQYILDANPANIFGGTGSLTIISHNTTTKRISGTFNFTAATLLPPIVSKAITVGTFDITYL